jgi:hypothetical protein
MLVQMDTIWHMYVTDKTNVNKLHKQNPIVQRIVHKLWCMKSTSKYKQLRHESGIVKNVIKCFNHSNELNDMTLYISGSMY